jgi:UDP-N-acetylmuramyl pentapeptide phosphotransferase/UDP-N-acetylglucosamine-1-phosphate transferase
MLAHFINFLYLLLLFVTLFTGMLVYFRIAEHYKIIDKPSPRSSHQTPTIRGGGIVFLLALLCWFALYRLSFPWLVIGATIIAAVSFADDIKSQPPLLRIGAQIVAFSMIMWHTGMYSHPTWLVIVMFVVGVGALNSFNFMDGINGMTGVLALVNLVAFYYINNEIIHFSYTSLIVCMIVAVVVFLYFNFRDHARCFAGDVGSMTIGFVQTFLLLQLIGYTDTFKWVLFFLVNGVEVVVSILYRLWNKRSIFTPHRDYFYQILVNEMRMSHLAVSLIYGSVQFIVNALVIAFFWKAAWWVSVVAILVAGFAYVGVRAWVIRRVRN